MRHATHHNRRRFCRLGLERLEQRLLLRTIPVTTTLDIVSDTDHLTSLREAITSANETIEPDTIVLPRGTYKIGIAGVREDRNVSGDFDIFHGLTIRGDSATIDAQALDRVFHILGSSIEVIFEGVTIQGGANDRGAGILVEDVFDPVEHLNHFSPMGPSSLILRDSSVTANAGDGVRAGSAAITVERSLVDHNGASGINTAGPVTVADSDVHNNEFNGISLDAALLSLSASSVRNNGGAGIATSGPVTLIHNSVVRNNGGSGIVSDSTIADHWVSLTDSRIQGNRGGGILTQDANVGLRNSTVSENPDGGIKTASGDVFLHDSTVRDNDGIYDHVPADPEDRYIADGGGIRTASGDVTLERSNVEGNKAFLSAGGIDTYTGNITLRQTTILRNTARHGIGGGIRTSYGFVMLVDSEVRGNRAHRSGGGIHVSPREEDWYDCLRGRESCDSPLTARGLWLLRSNVSDNHAGGPSRRYHDEPGSGGGIYVAHADNVDIWGSTISDNSAYSPYYAYSASGGGLHVRDAPLTIRRSVISNNRADVGGGVVAGRATIVDSTIHNNRASGSGGGVYVSDHWREFSITSSTISGNHASVDGGGVYFGEVGEADKLSNATISGNTANRHGGGIYVGDPIYYYSGRLNLRNVTIAYNRAADGGGILNFGRVAINVLNSLIAENSLSGGGVGRDVSGVFTSLGHNLIGLGTGSIGFSHGVRGDLVGDWGAPIDPRLEPLADNGGPTRTHALKKDSPALDAADTDLAPSTDQRGISRPRDGNGDGISVADIGAFESREDGKDFLW